MTFLLSWYQKAIQLSTHPKAPWYMSALAFLDASVFPISPLFMLLPMSFAAPKRSFYFGSLAVVASFLGSILGYVIGYYCIESFLNDFIIWLGYESYYQTAVNWFGVWGVWTLVIGSFVPVPYKIFTIGAGVMQLHFGLFLVGSLVGRIARFSLVAAIIYWSGPRVEPWIRRTLEKMSGVEPGQ